MKDPNFMYIGPSILPLGLKMNTLYRGIESMPPQLRNLINIEPMLTSLYVPTAKLGTARRGLKVKGAIEYLAWRQIIKMVEGERKTSNRR